MSESLGSNSKKSLIYENSLSSPRDIEGFVMEGKGLASFPAGRLRLEHQLPPEEGQVANIVLWCPDKFPDCIEVSWDFWPVQEPGLCIMFFAAKGVAGQSIFDTKSRDGIYEQYHHGDVNMLHLSYFRRKEIDERSFHTCNLRKSYGFHLVAQGADPIPSVIAAQGPYHMRLHKRENDVLFWINHLLVLSWTDDGKSFGPPLADGWIGFRQCSPLIAEYGNLKVYRLS